MNADVLEICQHFSRECIDNIKPLGNGLINETFLVCTKNQKFVLQQINSKVFPQPKLIMENMILLNEFLRGKTPPNDIFFIPSLLQTLSKKSFHLDKNKNYWRALEYIDNSKSHESIRNQEDAYKVGQALGQFHLLFNNAVIDRFHDTLPGFHITPEYFQNYQTTLTQHKKKLEESDNIKFCKKFIADFEPKINILENAKQQGFLINKITHGDPKLNNFLFDINGNNIISLIDLDTVKPGLIHYDIADCLRSCCQINNNNNNQFNLDICDAILKGYLLQTDGFLSEYDYQYLYPAIELIPFELGLRFFSDFLKGNQYFKVTYSEQNLNRAVAQFRLCQSIEKQQTEIKFLINKYQNLGISD